jgi:crotonobetainyl-CoA:carnitine CoA-transferase CaiB-like acyl-CoA transferase
MGLAPSVLHERNPGLVVVRISGWGQTGPYRRRPGFGTLVEGMSGFASFTGFPVREPVLPPIYLADSVAGLYGASGVMIAVMLAGSERACGARHDASASRRTSAEARRPRIMLNRAPTAPACVVRSGSV